MQDRLKQIVAPLLKVSPEEIDEHTSLRDISSLDFVTVVIKIEGEFGIYIPDEMSTGCSTFGELSAAVERLCGASV